MRTIWTIARYDLLRSIRERETFLIGLLMPAAMMFLLGISIGGGSPTITIDVIDADGSTLSRQFVTLLQAEMADSSGAGGDTDGDDDAAFRLCQYARDPDPDCGLDDDINAQRDDWRSIADERLEDTNTYGVIILEEGFGERVRAGEPVTVIFKNNNALSAPTLAEQKIDAVISRMGGSVALANLVVSVAADEFDAYAPGSAERADAFDSVRATVATAWPQRPVRVSQAGTQGDDAAANGFNQSGPGTAVMFVLIFMLNSAALLIYERETGTLTRLYTLPVSRGVILAGKILGRYVYGLGIFAMLIGVGALMGVEWGDDVIGIALIMLSFTLAATALGLLLSTLVRTSAQASNISLLLGLTLSPLGGAWWPLEIVPDFMKVIGHVSPVAWAMDAFQELMWYDGGAIDILPMIGVLLAMTTAFFVAGVVMFEYE